VEQHYHRPQEIVTVLEMHEVIVVISLIKYHLLLIELMDAKNDLLVSFAVGCLPLLAGHCRVSVLIQLHWVRGCDSVVLEIVL